MPAYVNRATRQAKPRKVGDRVRHSSSNHTGTVRQHLPEAREVAVEWDDGLVSYHVDDSALLELI